MCKMLDQYNDKIKGSFSFFDRMIINGYLYPLMNEHSLAGALYQLGVLYKNYKGYGTVHHRDGTESMKWKPMGKSISNLYRYAEVAKACNQRFLDAMVDIVPVKSTLDEIGKVCSAKRLTERP